MFEPTLQENFEKIFLIPKVSYDDPGENPEQECLFIRVDDSNPKISDKKEIYRVVGQGQVWAQTAKMPLGYFMRKINNCDPALKKDLFFSKIDQNEKVVDNIVKRTFDFVFLFSAQIDPSLGEISEVALQIQED